MADPIRVNGNLHSWGSITVKIGGERYYGFTGVAYGDKRERTHGHGMGRHHAPRGMSAGKYTPEPLKLTGYKASIQELREALGGPADAVVSDMAPRTTGERLHDHVLQIELADRALALACALALFRRHSF
jgi:hypothetical protein